jgi:uncharacterized protein
MSTHEFSIPISDLDAAGKQYSFPVLASWMRGALEGHEATAAGGDGKLDVRVSKSGNDVVVTGTLKAELTVPCARCLDPVKLTIDQTVSALMVPKASVKTARSKNEDEEIELSAEEADVIPYEGETVVLDDLVRDELVLETPMIPLCSEDCPGISPPPGAGAAGSNGDVSSDVPIDPRLAPLLRFKKMNEKKE